MSFANGLIILVTYSTEVHNMFEILKNLFHFFTSNYEWIFSLIALTIAVYGLTLWRKQLIGQVKLNAAKEIKKNLFELQDSIKSLRNPFISIDEMYYVAKKNGIDVKTIDDIQSVNEGTVFIDRFNRVLLIRNKLYKNILEGKLYWNEVDIFFKKIDKILVKIKIKLNNFIRIKAKKNFDNKDISELQDLEILFYGIDDNQNLIVDINTIFDEFHKFLNPILNFRG